MLRKIYVDGFRSLNDFSLQINRGTNVLVGPNGSGKSNILRFFDFVKDLQNHKLSEAVSKGGGAGAIFTRKAAERISRDMQFQLEGGGALWDQNIFRHDEHATKLWIYYIYMAAIRLDEDNRLVYDRQQVNVKISLDEMSQEVSDWTFVTAIEGTSSPVVLANNLERDLTHVDTQYRTYYANRLQNVADNGGFKNFSLPFQLSQFAVTGASKLISDICAGQVYNIIPSRVREPEDIAREPIVRADGSGLAATLLELRAREKEASFPRTRYYYGYTVEQNSSKSYEEVKRHFLNMNRNITDLDIKEDSYENTIKLSVKVKCGTDEVDMPFSFMSDGTVKWLVLVTAVISANSYLCMEEPENFIHPNLQSETAEFIRARCRQSSELFALVTTHSQTFLDASRPEELIIVTMNDGVTNAARIADVEVINKEISATGFGLGYYYISEFI